jgi:hypothetical protein
MNTKYINQINNKLKVIPDNFANEVLQYLEFLYFKNSTSITDFLPTDAQINLLDKRSKTLLEDCLPADKVMADLKNKFSV